MVQARGARGETSFWTQGLASTPYTLYPSHYPLSPQDPLKRLRGGLADEAHRLVYHSTLGLRVMRKTKTSLRTEGLASSRPTISTVSTASMYCPICFVFCVYFFFFFSFTLVTGPTRSLSIKLSDTRVYEPVFTVVFCVQGCGLGAWG